MQMIRSRRDFLAGASLAAAASAFGTRQSLAGEPPLETTTVRLLNSPDCLVPATIAEELVRAEGFSDVRYVDFEAGSTDVQMLIKGKTDIGMAFAPDVVRELDAGAPITVLAGVHPGCLELFVRQPIESIRDLKGRSITFPEVDYSSRLLLSVLASYIGVDPHQDIRFVTSSTLSPLELFAAGKTDAFLAVPPDVEELRARKIGRVILRTATDRPWSQYFCCVLVSRREYVRAQPVATKRLIRAILKATDMCAAEPQLAARRLVERVPTASYEYALEMMGDVPYGMWREFDPEDSIRFYALRLRDLGMIHSTPQEIIAEGSDWRFVNELKRELKA
jgi:NitT/TauT family transport system substrate-binding protein